MPRLFQRRATREVDIRPNTSKSKTYIAQTIPSIETLRNSEHEKATLTIPNQVVGTYLILRIELNDGKVGHFTVADFPGVEDPKSMATSMNSSIENEQGSTFRSHSILSSLRIFKVLFDQWKFESSMTKDKYNQDVTISKTNQLLDGQTSVNKYLNIEQFKSVREGKYIDTMLSHLRSFVGKSSGRLPSWSTVQVSDEWEKNPSYFWMPSISDITWNRDTSDPRIANVDPVQYSRLYAKMNW